MKKKPSYLKSRTRSLLSMAAKVAVEEGKAIVKKSADERIRKMLIQAETVVNHVGQLKGAAMKAVQMLTIEAQDILPPEVIQILEKLQSQAPPVSNQLMMQRLHDELGSEKFSRLKNISTHPFASASIGQVYSAELDDSDVVVKIQYPGIADTIDSDLDILKKLIKSLLFIYGKNIDTSELFAELKTVLKQETNYQTECENLIQYSKNFADDNRYVIPKVFPELSTTGVLTMSKEDGLELSQWVATGPSQQDIEIVGKRILDLYIKEFFECGFVQTDPNPANFLINKDNQLVLLDFGATLKYSDEFIEKYKKLVLAVFSQNDEKILDEVYKLGFFSHKESRETTQCFLDFLKMSVHPFSDDIQPFDFTESEYSNEIRKRALAFTKKIKYSAPPKELIFLHRKLGGVFLLLKKIGLTYDISYFRKQFSTNQ